MQNYSTTQAGNIGVIVGLIVMILQHWNINIASDEVAQIVVAVGVIVSWVGRYKKGDLTLSGVRK
jgi:Co/Zn/Cd efflux system component